MSSRLADGLLKGFTPRRFLRNGHLQTIAGNFLPRVDRLPVPEAVLVEVEPATESRIASKVITVRWSVQRILRAWANGRGWMDGLWRPETADGPPRLGD